MSDRTCPGCSQPLPEGASLNRRYCSPQCKSRVAYSKRPRVDCVYCGEPTSWGAADARSSGLKPSHFHCRPVVHGTDVAYRRRGCKCETCLAGARERQQSYIAEVKEREGVTPRVKYRKTPDVHCAQCGERLRFGGGGAPEGVTPRCLKCSRKRGYISRSVRLEVFERDGWCCQICGESTEPESDSQDDWYPTIDHILAVSLGGGDEVSNLRTAHRWCNVLRGVGDRHADLFMQPA